MQTNNQANLPSINFEDYLSRISSDISFAKHLFHSPICTAKQTSNSFLEKQCLGYLTDAERSINIALDTIRAYNRIVQNLETQMSRDMLQQLANIGYGINETTQDKNSQDFGDNDAISIFSDHTNEYNDENCKKKSPQDSQASTSSILEQWKEIIKNQIHQENENGRNG